MTCSKRLKEDVLAAAKSAEERAEIAEHWPLDDMDKEKYMWWIELDIPRCCCFIFHDLAELKAKIEAVTPGSEEHKMGVRVVEIEMISSRECGEWGVRSYVSYHVLLG
jgi:hypothetical protein